MKVIIEPYSPTWKEKFEEQKNALSEVLSFIPGISIEHIGSTAIPGMPAKPKVDILVGVPQADQLKKVEMPLQSRGYTYFQVYEKWMPYRKFFAALNPLSHVPIPTVIAEGATYVDGVDFRSVVHIHVMEKYSSHWWRHLAFRNYVMAHPDIQAEYAALKWRLSNLEFEDGNDYNKHKNDFMQRVEQDALHWQQQ